MFSLHNVYIRKTSEQSKNFECENERISCVIIFLRSSFYVALKWGDGTNITIEERLVHFSILSRKIE